jgi:FMN phosphatase YigB (HAD superfamily)
MSGSRFWGHWAGHSLYDAAHARIQRQFFAASPEILTQWMRGQWSAETIAAEIARRTNVPEAELLAGLQESCERMQLYDARLLAAVADVRQKGTKVVIATDNMDTFTRWTVPALGLEYHVDGILDSYSLRALKSDKDGAGTSKFFARYWADSGVEPSATVLIDDGEHNAVVQDFGMQYRRVTPQTSALDILLSITPLSK